MLLMTVLRTQKQNLKLNASKTSANKSYLLDSAAVQKRLVKLKKLTNRPPTLTPSPPSPPPRPPPLPSLLLGLGLGAYMNSMK